MTDRAVLLPGSNIMGFCGKLLRFCEILVEVSLNTPAQLSLHFIFLTTKPLQVSGRGITPLTGRAAKRAASGT